VCVWVGGRVGVCVCVGGWVGVCVCGRARFLFILRPGGAQNLFHSAVIENWGVKSKVTLSMS
jgi:hypothetical protein